MAKREVGEQHILACQARPVRGWPASEGDGGAGEPPGGQRQPPGTGAETGTDAKTD